MSDNGLIKYENKPVLERFTEYVYNSSTNRFVKSIIKGNIKFNPWAHGISCHRPEHHLRTCDSHGNRAKSFNDV